MTNLNKNFVNTLKKYINIVERLDVVNFEQNFDLLKNQLIQTKKDVYRKKDFYLICHSDPEYYLPSCDYGLTAFNLIRTFQEVDISTGRIMLVTNCFGYLKSFKSLIPIEKHDFELPFVIDDCISAPIYNFITSDQIKYLKNLPLDVQEIEYPASARMARARVHRHIIFNHISNKNLLNKVVTSYRNYANES